MRVLGGNAILGFLLSTVFSRTSGFELLEENGLWVTPQAWGFGHALTIIPDPRIASLLCAFGVLAAVTVILSPLHVRAIHFRSRRFIPAAVVADMKGRPLPERSCVSANDDNWV